MTRRTEPGARVGRSFRARLGSNANRGHCPLCGGDERPGTTTFAIDLTFGVVVVRDVPALVCEACGDAWIEDEVAEKLEAAVADARRKQTVVEVTRWPLGAA